MNDNQPHSRFSEKNKKSNTEEERYTIKSPIITNEEINPCVKEANLSNKCMFLNDYDSTMCLDVFDNYTMCRKFWKFVEWDRWMKGIKPSLPPVDQRPRIRKEMCDKFMRKEFRSQFLKRKTENYEKN